MEQQITLDRIRAIVEGATGRITERVDSVQREMAGGFKGTHARITEQADRVSELSIHVATTNGKVIRAETQIGALLLDMKHHAAEVVRLDAALDEVRLHRRSSDPPGLAVAHERKDDGPDRQVRWLHVGIFAAGASTVVALLYGYVLLKGLGG